MTALALDQVVQAAGALIAVLGLVLVAGWGLRLVRRHVKEPGGGRLRLRESLVLDARYRVVRIADGEREHVLVLGPTGATSLASGTPDDLRLGVVP